MNRPDGEPKSVVPDDRGSVHPMAALLVLVLDNLFWGANAMTLGVGTPVAVVLSFLAASVGVFIVQRNLAHESPSRALARALVLGILVGLPTSVAGTVVGGWLLLMAGVKRGRS